MASTTTATDSYPSPVTPRDSESEGSIGTSSMAFKAGYKRAASEIDEDADLQPRKKYTPGNTPSVNGRRQKDQGKESAMPADPLETIELDINFIVECPVVPDSKQYQVRLSRENLYTEHDAPLLPEAAHLTVDFSVKPGSQWSKLRRFKNAKFKDPVEVIYSAGQIVYVNRHWPIPPAPPADASEDEKLDYDRENFWVGLIAEFRAASQEKVYVRLFWLYWPEELPMGRQSYHGKRELVMSNHVDIVEAQSIACHTSISFWDENDDSNKVVLSERYWRQTYDLTKTPRTPRQALSKLRKFCICGGYDNPGSDMFQCNRVGCGIWNHQECLITNVEERAWGSFKKGLLGHEVEEQHKTFARKVVDKVGSMVEKSIGKSEVKDEDVKIKIEARSDHTSRGSQKPKLAPSKKRPWSGKLEGSISRVSKSPEEATHRATIIQLVPGPDSNPRSSFKPKIWNMELKCLRCQHPLN